MPRSRATFALSPRQTPILLSLLAILALTTGAALSAQPAAGNDRVQAVTQSPSSNRAL
jgi:hypothetical protein